MRRLVLLSVVLIGCMPPPPVYRVQRTARVPHAAAPLRTGEPLAGPAELSVGASSFGDVRAPRLVDEQASVELPSNQVRGELRLRIGRGEIAPIIEQAGGKMTPVDDTQARVEEGQPFGFGLATRYSIDTGAEGFSIGIGLEAMSWSIPYVEYRTCVENCEENGVSGTVMDRGTESVGSYGVAFTPTLRRGPLAMFAGTYARRHPTIVRKGTELYAGNTENDVDAGVFNVMVQAGVEYRLPVLSVMATVQQNLTRDPVWYGPSFGFAIAARLPERKVPPPRRYEPPPPPPQIVIDDGALPDDPW